jgi:hypothetical protein
MPQRNWLDGALDMVVDAMNDGGNRIDKLSQDQAPFDSVKLTPDEENLIYDNPSVLYPDETDPETGLPLTNAQAAQKLLQEKGAVEYVRFVTEMEKRRAKEAGLV